jgi:hypothetical protein
MDADTRLFGDWNVPSWIDCMLSFPFLDIVNIGKKIDSEIINWIHYYSVESCWYNLRFRLPFFCRKIKWARLWHWWTFPWRFTIYSLLFLHR